VVVVSGEMDMLWVGWAATMLVGAEFLALAMAATTTYVDALPCQLQREYLPVSSTGRVFSLQFLGWLNGACLTDEQVWCRYNHNRHHSCSLADCRAEEIRLTMYMRDDVPPVLLEPAYKGCSAGNVRRIFDHIRAMNAPWTFSNMGACGACVPEGDKRRRFLNNCSVAQAACRGLFYVPPRDHDETVPVLCPVENVTAHIARSPVFGCPIPWECNEEDLEGDRAEWCRGMGW
jgi:hypothetical protein